MWFPSRKIVDDPSQGCKDDEKRPGVVIPSVWFCQVSAKYRLFVLISKEILRNNLGTVRFS